MSEDQRCDNIFVKNWFMESLRILIGLAISVREGFPFPNSTLKGGPLSNKIDNLNRDFLSYATTKFWIWLILIFKLLWVIWIHSDCEFLTVL